MRHGLLREPPEKTRQRGRRGRKQKYTEEVMRLLEDAVRRADVNVWEHASEIVGDVQIAQISLRRSQTTPRRQGRGHRPNPYSCVGRVRRDVRRCVTLFSIFTTAGGLLLNASPASLFLSFCRDSQPASRSKSGTSIRKAISVAIFGHWCRCRPICATAQRLHRAGRTPMNAPGTPRQDAVRQSCCASRAAKRA